METDMLNNLLNYMDSILSNPSTDTTIQTFGDVNVEWRKTHKSLIINRMFIIEVLPSNIFNIVTYDSQPVKFNMNLNDTLQWVKAYVMLGDFMVFDQHINY